MTEKELMQEAHKLHIEKKEAAVNMNGVAVDAAARNNVSKQLLNRLKDYSYYRGFGWENGDPLVITKGTKFPDRVSPCMRRLAQIVADCQDAGCIDWLDEYFAALATHGIHVTVDSKSPVAKDLTDVKNSVVSMKAYQAIICSSADEIVELGKKAEEISFAPKNKFKELVSFYDRITDGKDVEDAVQNRVAFCELYENGLQKVNDDSLSG